jgi:hypothetical protein
MGIVKRIIAFIGIYGYARFRVGGVMVIENAFLFKVASKLHLGKFYVFIWRRKFVRNLLNINRKLSLKFSKKYILNSASPAMVRIANDLKNNGIAKAHISEFSGMPNLISLQQEYEVLLDQDNSNPHDRKSKSFIQRLVDDDFKFKNKDSALTKYLLNEDIAKALEDKGISSKVEEAPQAEIIQFRKKPTEPEGKADGGRIGYAQGTPAMGLDYLTGMGPSKGYADGGRIGFKIGSGKKLLNVISKVDDLKAKHKEAFKAHDQIFNVDINDKIAPDMIAESMAEMKGKDYFSLSQKEQSDLYKKALAYVDDVRMIKKQNQMSISNEMNQAKQEGIQKTNKMIELGLDPSSSKDYDKFLEMESIKQKYGNVIDDNLLQQILVDDNPQRKAEVLASIDEAIQMQQKGIAPEEIINIIKNTTRTKQAKGGSIGLNYLMGL